MESICNGGFYSQVIRKFNTTKKEIHEIPIKKQVERLSTFSLTTFGEESEQRTLNELDRSISAVFSNLINRGLPTLPSLMVERSIAETVQQIIGISEICAASGSIEFEFVSQDQSKGVEKSWQSKLIQAHFPIDPRITFNEFPSGLYDSDAEAIFHTTFLSNRISKFLPLLIQPQRSLDTCLPIKTTSEFINQRVDFSVELGNVKMIFEVDGMQHLNDAKQIIQDQQRDDALQSAGWDTFRIPVHQIENDEICVELGGIQTIQNDPCFSQYQSSFEQPLWKDRIGQSALTLILAPFGVARIQRALIQALMSGNLSFNMPVWKIVIIERDIRCGRLAVADFMQHIAAFLGLLGNPNPLPSVELKIFYTPEFSEYPILLSADVYLETQLTVVEKPFAEFKNGSTPGNALIDLSMLAYQGYAVPGQSFYDDHIKSNGTIFIIRNAFHFQDHRHLESNLPLVYQTDKNKNQNFEKSLVFFLQNIFRKKIFKDGQIEIIMRALALKPVIGLLPTGAGKSICYQLSGLLQPGMTLIVDPLNSLMMDQVDNLNNYFAIDWIGYINSNNTATDRNETMKRMSNGELLFIFLSPERLQNHEFRQKMTEMSTTISVSYAVIDEAHCVSEWGHDFRTSYLKMARTIHAYCNFKGKQPTVIALTGTASFTVLSDVQREIGVEEEDAIIVPKTFDREELHYEIISVKTKDKYQALKGILKELPNKFNSSNIDFFSPSKKETKKETRAGIIFTPHVSGKFGVYNLYQSIGSEINNPVHYFSGEVPKTTITNDDGSKTKLPVMGSEKFKKYKIDVQRNFKNDMFNVLVATSSFGMGIDKTNIGYVIHYNIPHSLEAYYQEAGRAGRDKKTSYCYIIYSDDEAEEANAALDSNATETVKTKASESDNPGDIHRLLYFHFNAYKGRNEEVLLIAELLNEFIYPQLMKMKEGQTSIFPIKFGSDRDKMAREKSIYRLAIIGLVDDYTVDFVRKVFEVKLNCHPDHVYIQNLQTYIQHYHTRERSEIVPDQVKGQKGKNVIEKCLGFLLNFVYQEIEKKRRTAIRTMAEVSRNAAKINNPTEMDNFIRHELIDYLQNSPFTQDLLKITQLIDPEEWHNILMKKDETDQYILNSVDGVRQLFGSCRRMLESHPDSPALLFFSALARLRLPDPDISAAMNEIHRAIETDDLQALSEEARMKFIRVVIDDIRFWLKENRDWKILESKIVEIILDAFPTREFAKKMVDIDPVRCENIFINLTLQEITTIRKRIVNP